MLLKQKNWSFEKDLGQFCRKYFREGDIWTVGDEFGRLYNSSGKRG